MAETLNITVAQNPADLVGPPARLDWLYKTLSDIPDATDMLVLPELFLSGYNIADQVTNFSEPANGPNAQKIAALAIQHNIAIIYGFPETEADKIYNSALCIDANGAQIAKHRKLQLPPGYEGDHFTAGDTYTLFKYRGFTISILICYDAEFPETYRHVATNGAELVIVPTALGAEWGVVATRVIPTRAFENGVFTVYANQAGTEHGMDYFGGSCLIAPDGSELARAGGQPQLITAQLNRADVKSAQARLPYHTDLKKLPNG